MGYDSLYEELLNYRCYQNETTKKFWVFMVKKDKVNAGIRFPKMNQPITDLRYSLS